MWRRVAFISPAALLVGAMFCPRTCAQITPPISITIGDLSATRPAACTPNHADSEVAAPIHVTTNASAPEGVVRWRGRAWFALGAGGQGAALADVKTTLDLKRSHPLTFYEADPLARPFVNLPRPAYVASVVGLTASLSAVTWKLRASEHPLLRRLWWAPQAAQIALNTECAIRNARK